ncbi:hypothetical protein LTR97_007706 [Elasticomyces elasticus]|uniref:EthD domain-containing protein n=1 Tax=Elasticomyces elasticus TaxID=574655 RepID=A0AAN7ZTH4_9PEZI|nr:hypothetical protein LTR97_007706 [Elasticomyces elasticus]
MVFQTMVMAHRKPGVSHEQFKKRYEQHMQMVAELCGDATPSSHTRFYPVHGADDQPVLMAGNNEPASYSVVVLMEFEHKVAFEKFCGALATEDSTARIEADEAGFWDRSGMKVFEVEAHRSWGS